MWTWFFWSLGSPVQHWETQRSREFIKGCLVKSMSLGCAGSQSTCQLLWPSLLFVVAQYLCVPYVLNLSLCLNTANCLIKPEGCYLKQVTLCVCVWVSEALTLSLSAIVLRSHHLRNCSQCCHNNAAFDRCSVIEVWLQTIPTSNWKFCQQNEEIWLKSCQGPCDSFWSGRIVDIC